MAEAAVEMPVSPRYFCHQCTQEINPVLPDYVCPRCQGGFIEIVENEPSSEGNWPTSAESNEELNPEAARFNEVWEDFMRRLDSSEFMRLPSTSEGQSRVSEADSSSEPSSSTAAESRTWMPYSYDIRLRQQTSRQRRRRRPMFPEEVVQMMLTVASRASNVSNSGVPILLNLHGNPGDYAWGRGGLDAVITQLLNQLDGTGPPPLPKEKIDEIPDVQIVQEQVDIALQCTVCMEDFCVGESVKRLSCQHHFHEDCIIPWLKLHGTCPICRKLLNEDSSVDDTDVNYGIFGSVSASANSSSAPDRTTSSSAGSSSMSGESSQSSATSTNPTNNTSVYEFTEDYD